jgi:hypothetical protein
MRRIIDSDRCESSPEYCGTTVPMFRTKGVSTDFKAGLPYNDVIDELELLLQQSYELSLQK